MKKKLVAIVALAAMLLTMLPFAAFAAEPNPNAANISIDVIEFNNDMSRDQVIVSISGTGLSVGMPVYVVASGQAQPVYSGYIYATGRQNNFYIDKADIPGIDSTTSSTLTVTVMSTQYNEILESQVFDKVTVPNAPEKMEAYFDNAGGTKDRDLTVKFDADYVRDSSDQIVLQALDKDGDEVGNPERVPVSSGKFATGLDSNDMKTLTFSRDFDFDSKAVSVRVSFERNNAIIEALNKVVELESPYGELDELVLDFGDTLVERGETVQGKVYYVNTEGKRYDITDEVTGFAFTPSVNGIIASSDATKGTLTIADNATLGSTITAAAIYRGENVKVQLTVISDTEPGDVKMAKSSDICGEEIGMEFTLLDDSGNPMKLNFFPTNIQIRWIDSSVADATMTVNMTDLGSNLQREGVIRAALECDKPCSGKFELTFTDSNGHAYQVVSNTFTFTDPNAKPSEPTGADKITVTIGSTTMQVDGKNVAIDAPPIIDNSRTYVPLRAIGEAFGADVYFDDKTNLITIDLDDTHITMTPYRLAYTVNGVNKTMDVAPYISAAYGRTMVPARFIAEALGFDSSYTENPDGTTHSVTFTAK